MVQYRIKRYGIINNVQIRMGVFLRLMIKIGIAQINNQ